MSRWPLAVAACLGLAFAASGATPCTVTPGNCGPTQEWSRDGITWLPCARLGALIVANPVLYGIKYCHDLGGAAPTPTPQPTVPPPQPTPGPTPPPPPNPTPVPTPLPGETCGLDQTTGKWFPGVWLSIIRMGSTLRECIQIDDRQRMSINTITPFTCGTPTPTPRP